MSVDKGSLPAEVQHGEPSQTANTPINNQEIKKDDLATATTPETSTTQPPGSNVSTHGTTISTNDSDANKHAAEIKPTSVKETSTIHIPDSDANKQSTTTSQIHDSDTNKKSAATSSVDHKNSLPTAELATSQMPDSDANKQSTMVSTDAHGNPSSTTVEPSTSQIPDSDANKRASAVTTPESPKSSTNMVPTSNQDSNSDNQTNPLTSSTNTKQATNQNTKTTATDLQTNKDDHGNPLPAVESSTSQTPGSDATKQANTGATHDLPKSSTTNQDSKAVDQTKPPTTDSDTKQATNQSTQAASTDQQTNKDDHVNPLPTVGPSTSQVPDSDANKQPDETATHDLPKSSTTKLQPSNQDHNSDDQTDSDTKDTTKQSTETTSTDKDSPPSAMNPNEERKHLVTLIKQEIQFVIDICPKLGKHEEFIEKEAEKAKAKYEELTKELCDLKELKVLKKTVTKLKLQIPARYRTYDQSDKQKYQQSDVENRGIPPKLLKKLPRLQDKLFHQSPLCKTIHLRFNELRHELKLCLLCFSAFPEKAMISRRSMVYWWIGEGLIPQEDDLEGGKTAEDCANEFFKELMDMDFIEPVMSKSYGRYVVACKMHPMVRAALVMIADKVKFFDFDEYGNPKDFGKFDEIESPEDVPEVYPLGDPREFFDFFGKDKKPISGRIEFYDSKRNPYQFAPFNQEPIASGDGKASDTNKRPVDRDGKASDTNKRPVDRDGKPIDGENYYFYQKKKITTKSFKACLMGSGLSKGLPWEKLHMLFNVNDDMLEFKPEWFLRMKNINILSLGRWQSSAAHHIEVGEFEFDKSLDYMNHVRYFSLQGVSRVSKLPDSISKLKTLLILDLRACHNLEDIPETIGSLKCLTHLDISECYLLKKIPKEIALLESLQVLKGFVVVESATRDVCTLEDLKTLENLKKLSMYTHMKDFPQESHLDALQKFETLRKLTILWGGHESTTTPETNKPKEVVTKTRHNLASKFITKLGLKKKRVSIRRMNAFSNSTLGSRLEKLDLKCFPHRDIPTWLTPGNLQGLKKLYIRGGCFSDLGQYQDSTVEWDDATTPPKETWNVEILRLKYLEELNMEWRELQNLFPRLKSLEKVKCPKLTLFPCNEHGVWIEKGATST